MLAALAQARDRATPAAVHDTVAAILREPEYAHAARESLLGRAVRYLLERLAELFRQIHGSPGTRLFVIAAVAVIVVVVIGRVVMAREADANAARYRPRARHGGSGLTDAWMAAESLATRGLYTEACHLLYAAVLSELARMGLIARHPSKTSGDYWREMRDRGVSAAATFRAFAVRFDRVIYGVGEAGADDYAALVRVARDLTSSSVRAA